MRTEEQITARLKQRFEEKRILLERRAEWQRLSAESALSGIAVVASSSAIDAICIEIEALRWVLSNPSTE